MTRVARRVAVTTGVVAAAGSVAGAVYVGLVTAAAPLDLRVGRQMRPLGPLTVDIRADRELVFDLLAQPYLGRTTRALREMVTVVERGTDMVLAEHHTPVGGRLVATTVETVRFTRPERIDFRLVRGPVPHVVERFELTEESFGTRLHYAGELGTDLWSLGRWWGEAVARPWERAVDKTFRAVAAEAERRSSQGRTPG